MGRIQIEEEGDRGKVISPFQGLLDVQYRPRRLAANLLALEELPSHRAVRRTGRASFLTPYYPAI